MSKKVNEEHRINQKINQWGKVNEVRVVGEGYDGVILPLQQAIDVAFEKGMDLVEINPNSEPPTCKIIDYSKFLFDKKKKQKEIEKNNKKNAQDVKELRFTPNTDDHDFDFKQNHAIKFLKDGDKVKAYVFFKGRELTYKNKGEELLLKLAKNLEDISKIESYPKLEGNKMYMTLTPNKK